MLPKIEYVTTAPARAYRGDGSSRTPAPRLASRVTPLDSPGFWNPGRTVPHVIRVCDADKLRAARHARDHRRRLHPGRIGPPWTPVVLNMRGAA